MVVVGGGISSKAFGSQNDLKMPVYFVGTVEDYIMKLSCSTALYVLIEEHNMVDGSMVVLQYHTVRYMFSYTT